MTENKNTNETTIATIPRLISQVLSIYEVDNESVFENAGLSYEEIINTDSRIAMQKMSDLWASASEATNNKELGLLCASIFQPAYIKGLGLAWMASENLLEGLKLFVKNSQLVNTAFAIDLDISAEQVTIKYKPAQQLSADLKIHPCAIQLGVGFFIKMFRVAAGKKVPATGVYFTMPINNNLSAYEDYFQCPVHHSETFNGIAFSKALLLELLPAHDSELVESNKASVEKYISTLKQKEIITNVTSIILSLLSTGNPTEEEVAFRLHMSKRTLQRKLKTENLVFSGLLNNIRFKLASEYLSDGNLSVTEIAYQLGYATPSTFSRAFKQKFSMSPLEYRNYRTS